MRTTLDIEEDILLAAKEIARQKKSTAGRVLSDLARQALAPTFTARSRSGFPLFPIREDAGVATLDLVNRLRDESS